MSLIEELLNLLNRPINTKNYDDEFFSKFLAFRIKGGGIEPVKHPSIPEPDSLLGIENQKETLLRNTKQFVEELPANDVLLWGDRGTGKSSLVRTMLKPFADKGLRIVQVYKWDIPSLSELYASLRNRKQKFILFFDDLSFKPEEDSFRLLKSLLDGDIEERPQNVLVYATSNRRHLIPDMEREEKFPSESMQERISLIDRFGIRLGFFSFGKEQYLNIVRFYLKERNLRVKWEEIESQAMRWATERGNLSGRTAYQFVKDLEGRLNLPL